MLANPGNNYLMGMDGDDILEGRGGADGLDGGRGSDTASYESSPAGVWVSVNDPVTGAFVAHGGDATGDVLFSIEILIGSAYDDVLIGAGNNNVFVGGRGNDIIDGGGGTDTVDYSTEGLDSVNVNLGLSYAAEYDNIFFNRGLPVSGDHLYNIENVIGTAGKDQITGNEKSNTLEGRGGNDTIDGGFGNDTLDGGSGINTVSFQSHDQAPLVPEEWDVIALGRNGAAGDFELQGRPTGATYGVLEQDTLWNFQNVTGSNHAEAISGNEQDNTINGRGGDDVINGFEGNDILIGGDGNDRLLGYTGGDTLTGGRGADTFIFTSNSDSPYLLRNVDTITDFEQDSDKLDFSLFDGDFSQPGQQHLQFSASATINPGEIHSRYDAARDVTVVEAHVFQGVDFNLELRGHVDLTESDFIL